MKYIGTVQRGNKIGRTINFPTANLNVKDDNIKFGVYASKVIYDNKEYFGISNYGLHLTIKKLLVPILETHILDFDKEIYDEKIEVELIKFIREEKDFSNLEKLKNQLEKDKDQVLKILEK